MFFRYSQFCRYFETNSKYFEFTGFVSFFPQFAQRFFKEQMYSVAIDLNGIDNREEKLIQNRRKNIKPSFKCQNNLNFVLISLG